MLNPEKQEINRMLIKELEKREKHQKLEEIVIQVLSKQRIKKLANDLDIELIKRTKKPILSITGSISNGKNLKKEPIDSNL